MRRTHELAITASPPRHDRCTRNRINADRRTVYLSKIFEWYAEDFGGSANVLKYVDMHHPDRLKGYAVRYLEYDWTLNIQKMGMKKQ